jgi:hypothetical protein
MGVRYKGGNAEAVVGRLVVASTGKPQVPVNNYLHEGTDSGINTFKE